MEIKVAGRQSGKTLAMLEWIEQLEDPSKAVIVCHSRAEAARVGCLYNERNAGKPLPRFVTPEGARRVRAAPGPVFVDNADILLEELLGRRIDKATMTGRVIW